MKTVIKMCLCTGYYLKPKLKWLKLYIYSWTHVSILRSVGWFNLNENNDAKVKTHKKVSYYLQFLVQIKNLIKV